MTSFLIYTANQYLSIQSCLTWRIRQNLREQLPVCRHAVNMHHLLG